MTQGQQRKMEHAVGLDHKHPRGGRYEPYRNYYAAKNDDADWEQLVANGYAEKEVDKGGYVYYGVTEKGFEYLSKVNGFKVGIPSLELVLKPEWYDMIESGEKPEEYREITPHWRVRICRDAHSCQMREVCKANIYCHYEGGVPMKRTVVTFHRAYTKTVMKFEIEKVVVGFGREEWGAKPGVKYYVIKLGKRI